LKTDIEEIKSLLKVIVNGSKWDHIKLNK
jgi:hypothetical protein